MAEKVGDTTSVNNASWWENVKMLEFLATYGRHIRVSSMLARDSIQSRLELGGIGFNEFTYQILQAYDFGICIRMKMLICKLENDQWGILQLVLI